MTQDNWQDCPTMKSVVEALERGDEIEVQTDAGNAKYCKFKYWTVDIGWHFTYKFRCRPAKPKTKKVVMREMFCYGRHGWYQWVSTDDKPSEFVRYTGNERTEEVPDVS